MRIWVFGLALALAAGSAAAQDLAPPGLAFELHLDCTAAHAGGEVFVDVTGDQGRILLARAAAAHKRGNDDWRPLSDIQVDDHLITARFSTGLLGGLLGGPSMTVDRMTGRIDISGSRNTAFHGDCTAIDPNAARKF
ncbi:MAG TPA: hypothetical protein VHZ26_15595 [Caulobacteraceae bacterium]|jgi:hypothetical protein|nr:hypothetical protein [Caulobacteraceae bacterium]